MKPLYHFINKDQFSTPSPLEWHEVIYGNKKLEIAVKRDDLIHPLVSGNKWRKLKYYPLDSNDKTSGILTMGGGYSNFVLAIGFLTKALGIPLNVLTTHSGQMTYLMKWCARWGVEFTTISRQTMRAIRSGELNPLEMFPHAENMNWIPEGGGGNWSARGITEMIEEVKNETDSIPLNIILAAGTGVTATCVAQSIPSNWKLSVFPAVSSPKFYRYLDTQLLATKGTNFELLQLHNDKGIGTIQEEDSNLIREFYIQTGILLDPFYNGKAFSAHIKKTEHTSDLKTVLIHSGGTQAWLGLRDKFRENNLINFLADKVNMGDEVDSHFD